MVCMLDYRMVCIIYIIINIVEYFTIDLMINKKSIVQNFKVSILNYIIIAHIIINIKVYLSINLKTFKKRNLKKFMVNILNYIMMVHTINHIEEYFLVNLIINLPMVILHINFNIISLICNKIEYKLEHMLEYIMEKIMEYITKYNIITNNIMEYQLINLFKFMVNRIIFFDN